MVASPYEFFLAANNLINATDESHETVPDTSLPKHSDRSQHTMDRYYDETLSCNVSLSRSNRRTRFEASLPHPVANTCAFSLFMSSIIS